MLPVPIPSVPVPPPLIPFQYTPFRAPLPLPPPGPEVIDPLPDVLRQYEQEQKKRELQQKEIEIKSKPKKPGFLGTLVSFAEEGFAALEKGFTELSSEIDRSVRSTTFEGAQKNFRNFFRLPGDEQLWREYMCRCISDNVFFTGYMYISDSYVAFAGDKRLPLNPTYTVGGAPSLTAASAGGQTMGPYRLAFLLPFRNVASIHKGSCTAQTGQLPPMVQHIPLGSAVKPEAIIFLHS